MWLWTRQEAKRIDKETIRSGIPAEKLMETAGQMSADSICRWAPSAQNILVLCGPGNNGGDGFVLARELSRRGLKVQVIEINSPQNSPLRDQKKSEYQDPTLDADQWTNSSAKFDLVVDALFGIGLSRPLEGKVLELLRTVNLVKARKVALDTPSGLDVDTGLILGAAFAADLTLTVGHAKPGFFLNEGPRICGKIHCLDIGFSKTISQKAARDTYLLSEKLVRNWIPNRRPTDNKSKGGKTLIWAGSAGMPGAAVLACKAAMRVGSGYIYSTQPETLRFCPEAILWKKNSFEKMNSVLIGPGLGTGKATAKAIESLKRTALPVVIDADALNVTAREKLYPFPAHWIATPHAGELSRFLPLASKEIEADRLAAAAMAQSKLGCTVLLKGFHTVVALPQLRVIIPTGNVSLAKGGSGDVLGGMIAGFLSEGLGPERATLLASYVHGKIADLWTGSGNDFLSLMPSDLIAALPRTLAQIRKAE